MPDDIIQLFKLIGLGLAFLLPMANPLTAMVMYLSLGESLSAEEKKQQLRQATLCVILALLVTYYAGLWITSALGISMVDIRIAGGLIVAYIGFRMLFPPAVSDMVSQANDQHTASHNNIAFVPLTLPSTVGPGTMALVLSASSQMHGMRGQYAQWVLMVAPVILAVLIGLNFFHLPALLLEHRACHWSWRRRCHLTHHGVFIGLHGRAAGPGRRSAVCCHAANPFCRLLSVCLCLVCLLCVLA